MALFKKEAKIEEEIQTTFNEDGMDELCADDTVVENVEEAKVEEKEAE